MSARLSKKCDPTLPSKIFFVIPHQATRSWKEKKTFWIFLKKNLEKSNYSFILPTKVKNYLSEDAFFEKVKKHVEWQ